MPAPLIVSKNELSEIDIMRLAREISRDLKPLEAVLSQMQITSEQFERIKENPIFHFHLTEEAGLWASTTRENLTNRIATKAAFAVDQLMYEAIDLVQDKKLGGEARIKALQFLAKLGQLTEGQMTKDDGSGRVTINILLGNRKLSFDKDNQPRIIDHEPTPEVSR
jgi:hypothetical protein